MDTFDKDQFWAALNRLYESTLRHDAQIEELVEALKRTQEALKRTEKLGNQLGRWATTAEKRLRRLEGR